MISIGGALVVRANLFNVVVVEWLPNETLHDVNRTSEEGKSREIPWRTLKVPNPLERRFAIRRFDSDYDNYDNRDDSYPTKWYGYLLHTLANRIFGMEEIGRSGARDGKICDEEIEQD